MELVQIRLLVTDFSAAFRFYRDVLGWTPQVDDERGPYAKLSSSEGGCAIALHARDDFARTAFPLRDGTADRALIVLKVADVDACVALLESRGAPIAREPTDAWGRLRVAYVRDPEGNLLELQQWLAPRA